MQVQDFLKVERFAHVHHLVSEVRGTLRPESDVFDLLAATLPPGSVTGAPKHRALEIIDALEASARGAYCGTVFRIGVDGSMDSAVIIRSFECTGQVMRIGVGGGITILSDPQKEYEEMRLKLAPFAAFAEGA
jgi:para-aminobenzoate synthetase component 1